MHLMPIKSYIVIPQPNQLEQLSSELSKLQGCNVHPAENKEVLVLVTETDNEEKDKILLAKIEACQYLQHLSLVSGFD